MAAAGAKGGGGCRDAVDIRASAGQISFYLSAVDALMKAEADLAPQIAPSPRQQMLCAVDGKCDGKVPGRSQPIPLTTRV